MSDENVSYQANLQTASTKSRATMGLPAKCFSDGVFLVDREWPDFTCLLGASRSVFESTCIYSQTWLRPGATGNMKVIEVSPQKSDLVYQHFSVNRDIHNM